MSGQKPWKEKASLSSRSVLGPAKLLCIFWATFFCSCSQTWSIYKHYFARKTKREDQKAEIQIGFWSFTIAHSRLEESGNEVNASNLHFIIENIYIMLWFIYNFCFSFNISEINWFNYNLKLNIFENMYPVNSFPCFCVSLIVISCLDVTTV